MYRSVELSAEPRMARRVRRLGFVSLVALGLIWALAEATVQPPALDGAALITGWALMPALLFASLRRPGLRVLLPLPATLVGGGLIALLLVSPPASPLAAAGWLLMVAGVALGGVLGLWFWYRWLPVPSVLDDLESPARWALIALHVALIVIGWGLAATALV